MRGMFCLGCGYVLDNLPEPRCPECGRAFDPQSPATFAMNRRRRFRNWRRAAIYLVPLPVVSVIYAVQFGRDAVGAIRICSGGPSTVGLLMGGFGGAIGWVC